MKRIKFLKWFLFSIILSISNHTFANPFSAIYVMGDSLSDQGNLFTATESVIGSGIPADDLYFMGRFTNGKNYVDELASKLGIVLTPSILLGDNFAYGGTRADYNSVEISQGGLLPDGLFPWTLNSQRDAFDAQGVNNPYALYIVFSGSNDLSDLIVILSQSIPVDIDAYIENAVNAVNQAIESFVIAGARDIIVPNVANLGVVPGVTQFGPAFAALASAITMQYNDALQAMLEQWDGVVNIIPVNSFSFLTQITTNPAEFGFTNASDACYTGFVLPAGPDDTVCDNPEEYVFWDSEHPTAAFHKLFSDHLLAETTSDILDDLIQQISNFDLPKGISRSLTAKLLRVKKNFQSNRNKKAINGPLRAFVFKVRALSGKKISAENAEFLIFRAKQVYSLLTIRGNKSR